MYITIFRASPGKLTGCARIILYFDIVTPTHTHIHIVILLYSLWPTALFVLLNAPHLV